MKPLKLPKAATERNYDALDPLDSRYYDAGVAYYLSERSRVAYQAYVETALAYTLAEFKICSPVIAQKIETAARMVSVEEVYVEERHTKHDIKALVNCIKAKLDADAQPFVHFGATSYDIIANASALQLRSATTEVILPRLRSLLGCLLDLTDQHAKTRQIGRTHGQHAVPITFGFAIAGYVERLGSNLLAVRELANQLSGKFSGAVGAYNALSLFVDDPWKFEASVLKKLDLPIAPYSTQIIPAEATIRLLDELAITAGIMANLAHDMRHLQRTEIAEVRERFEAGQTGSSTMAHKRNPWNFENVISMSKQVTAQMLNANLNITSEHQRDLTDSASSRFYTIALASVASMLERLTRIMSKLEVDELNMQRNLQLTGGAIAAEPLYLLLEKYGHTTAHEVAKQVAHSALAAHKSLFETLQNTTELAKYVKQLSASEKRILQEPETYYIGLASKRADAVSKRWRKQLG
jgi:adenylosuccinate lyase